MKVLYISTAFPRAGTSTIYTDLEEALRERDRVHDWRDIFWQQRWAFGAVGSIERRRKAWNIEYISARFMKECLGSKRSILK